MRILICSDLHWDNDFDLGTAVLGSPLVKACAAHAIGSAEIGHGGASLGLLQNLENLCLAVSRRLHGRTPNALWKILLPCAAISWGDYSPNS